MADIALLFHLDQGKIALPPPEHRVLDDLAYLLRQNWLCAATAIVNNQLIWAVSGPLPQSKHEDYAASFKTLSNLLSPTGPIEAESAMLHEIILQDYVRRVRKAEQDQRKKRHIRIVQDPPSLLNLMSALAVAEELGSAGTSDVLHETLKSQGQFLDQDTCDLIRAFYNVRHNVLFTREPRLSIINASEVDPSFELHAEMQVLLAATKQETTSEPLARVGYIGCSKGTCLCCLDVLLVANQLGHAVKMNTYHDQIPPQNAWQFRFSDPGDGYYSKALRDHMALRATQHQQGNNQELIQLLRRLPTPRVIGRQEIARSFSEDMHPMVASHAKSVQHNLSEAPKALSSDTQQVPHKLSIQRPTPASSVPTVSKEVNTLLRRTQPPQDEQAALTDLGHQVASTSAKTKLHITRPGQPMSLPMSEPLQPPQPLATHSPSPMLPSNPLAVTTPILSIVTPQPKEEEKKDKTLTNSTTVTSPKK